MVRIMRVSDGKELGIYEEARYIRKAKNGCYVRCDRKNAEGVSAGGDVYSIVGKDQMDGKEFAFVSQVDAGMFAMQTKQTTSFVNNVIGVTEATKSNTGEETTSNVLPTADRDYEVGEYLSVDGVMYKVVLPIFAGTRITIGTNVEETNIASEMALLKKEDN